MALALEPVAAGSVGAQDPAGYRTVDGAGV
jgi:hypothetical protein